MDAEYLKRNIGDVLADGLAACMVQSPEDPVDFLSQFLLNYVENRKRSEGQPLRAIAIQQLELKSNKHQTKRIAAIDAKSAAQYQRVQFERDFIEKSTRLIWPIEVINEFVNLLQHILKTTGVYAGIVEEVEGQKCIRYFTATPGHEFMIGQRLQPPALTLSLLEPQSEAEQEKEPDQAESEKQVVQQPYKPKTLHIPNTVLGDCQRSLIANMLTITLGENPQKIKFFRRKDIGSYGAILIEYGSLLNDAALALEDGTYRLGPKPSQPEPIETAAQTDAEPADENETPTPEPELIEAPRTPTQFLVAFDTIGQSREISKADYEEATRLSLVMREQLLEADIRAFTAEREWRKSIAKFASNPDPVPSPNNANSTET